MCMTGCRYLKCHEPARLGRSDYLPMCAWGKAEEDWEYWCTKMQDYCNSEDEPDTCPIQKETNYICPSCQEDELGDFPLLKNAAGIWHCENGHRFSREEEVMQ